MAVEIKGDTFCYPHFKDGQVLTHNDLNQLRDYLYTKSMFHSRALFGFGVGCGLEGVLSGASLEFSSGFALAQGGLELIYPDAPASARTVALGSVTKATETYSFIDAAAGGMTAILRPLDVLQPAGGTCTSEGCTTHTDLHCQQAEIVWVTGRLRLDTLAADAALELKPIIPASNPSLTGFASLRDALYSRLSGLVDQATRDLLKALTLTGPAGIDLLKVGIVNEVLYTLWDYLQCRRAQTVPCMGEPGVPAVALGHASQTGTTWTWDQRYRHYFRLSLALHRAIRGYRGQELCERHLNHIRAIVEDFTPPPIPEDEDEVEEADPDYHICLGTHIATGICLDWKGTYREKWPPYGWVDPLQEHDPIIINPLDDPVYMVEEGSDNPWVVAGHLNGLDPVMVGTVNSYPLLGKNGKKTAELVKKLIGNQGFTPSVHAVTEEEFGGIEGIQPALLGAASDGIYFATNPAGAITGMGIVPTSQNLGQVTTIASEAGQALEQVGQVIADVGTVTGRVGKTEQNIATLQGGLHAVDEKYGDALETLAVDLGQKITDVRTSLPPGDKLSLAVSLADKYEALSGDVRELQGKIEVRDRAIGGGVVVGDKAVEANRALKGSLDTLATAIERSATTRQVTKVREALARLEPALAKLDEATESGVLMTAAQPEALAVVMEGMTDAVVAAGVATNSVEFSNLRNGIDALRHTMGVPRA
jgi:hypothetical protein